MIGVVAAAVGADVAVVGVCAGILAGVVPVGDDGMGSGSVSFIGAFSVVRPSSGSGSDGALGILAATSPLAGNGAGNGASVGVLSATGAT